MPQGVSPGFQARRALLRSLAPRYQQASPAQKTLLLAAFVEWTGYTRKYAIALLNHGQHDQQIIERRRLSQYGQGGAAGPGVNPFERTRRKVNFRSKVYRLLQIQRVANSRG